MRGVIQQAKPSKSGKTLGVQINGQWYTTKEWGLQNMVGQEIVAEPEASEYKGQTMYWINAYTLVGAPTGPVNPAEHAPQNVTRGTSSMSDKDMEIWCQSILKAWIGPEDGNDRVTAKVAHAYGLYPRRHSLSKPDTDLSPGLPDPEFPTRPEFDDGIPFSWVLVPVGSLLVSLLYGYQNLQGLWGA